MGGTENGVSIMIDEIWRFFLRFEEFLWIFCLVIPVGKLTVGANDQILMSLCQEGYDL